MSHKKCGQLVRFGSNYYDEPYYTVKGVKGLYDKAAYARDNIFHKRVADLIIKVLDIRPNDRKKTMLDVGCALGNLVLHLEDLYLDAYGVDISAYAIPHSHIPKKVRQADVIVGIPFPNEYFDYIFSRETLEHIHEYYIPRVLKELYRVTKKGGLGLFSPANNTYDKEERKQSKGNPCNDESHLCNHPSEFLDIVRPAMEGGLSEPNIKAMFDGLGQALRHATTRWEG